jgi:hypothetical protein
LTSNALRITNLETSNGLIRTDLTSNALRITNLETSNGLIRTDLTSNALRITNLETSNGLIRTDLTSNALRITNLETDKAPLLDPVFTNNVTVSGNLTVLGTTTTLDTENLVVKDPIIALSNTAGTVDSGVLINRPGGTNNVFSGFDHSASEYVMGLTDSSAYESVIVMKENENFVANIYGNVKANYFVGDGSLLTGVSSGGASTLQEVTDLGNTTSNVVQFTGTGTSLVASGDIEAKNIQLTDPGITTSFASGMLTIDAANKTYGTGSLITLTQNMTALSYSNLIEGSQVIIPVTSLVGNYTVSNAFSNVDYHVYSDVATISAGNQGLMTVSNLNGNVYMNMLPFQDLPTGSGGGGASGYTTGDLTVTGGLTITDLDVTANITGNVLTLDGANKTFGVSPILEMSSNIEHLVFSNLIHGSDIKLLMNAFTAFTVGGVSNVNRYSYNNITTVTAGDIALMTFSNLHGSIYADLKISYSNSSFYIAATGGTVTDVGGYRIHTFTSSGTLSVTTSVSVEYLVVAGGGGGGGGRGGGGGAGGLLFSTAYSVVNQSYTVTIGAGGAGSTVQGANGNSSSFGAINATGGGGGGSSTSTGSNGGSGGGGGDDSGGPRAGGTGISGQGFAGGTSNPTGSRESGGGGGGAGAVGGNGVAGTGGNGGDGGIGLQNSISGSAVYYAGGGGGSSGYGTGALKGTGGLGGGGDGSQHSSNTGSDAVSGTLNTGGGGGGGTYNDSTRTTGASGGSGIVIIRYAI